MFCTRCGQQNPADARFCARCGNELLRPGEPVAQERPSEQTSTLNLAAISAAIDPEGDEHQPDTEAQSVLEALPPGAALLVVKRGPNAGSRFSLDEATTTAGRHPDSDIFLDDVTVSRRHAEFRREGHTYHLHDVGSLNGTYLNRERIDSAPLDSGDEVQIGKFRLVFLAGVPAAG